jgi:glycosyltransferase involved in cell wall biosynthesis
VPEQVAGQDNCRVSVIVPVYNGELYLAEAIESILAQTYQPFEVIIVDDGSTDRSSQIARSFGSPVEYCYQPNSGTAAARNRGIESAGGNHLAFLDADDLWLKDKLKHQVAAFLAQGDLDLVSGHVEQFYSTDVEESVRKSMHCPEGQIPSCVMGASLIKRDSFLRVGWFETEFILGADLSWYIRAREAGLQMKILSQVVMRRRLHQTNKGVTQGSFASHRLQILKASLDRRRHLQKEMSDQEEKGNIKTPERY